MTQATLKAVGPRLNLEVCNQFKQNGKDLIARTGAKHLIVDMSEVTFVDSSGIGALVALRKAVGEDGSVCLLNTTDFVERVIKLTRLESVFEVRKAA